MSAEEAWNLAVEMTDKAGLIKIFLENERVLATKGGIEAAAIRSFDKRIKDRCEFQCRKNNLSEQDTEKIVNNAMLHYTNGFIEGALFMVIKNGEDQ